MEFGSFDRNSEDNSRLADELSTGLSKLSFGENLNGHIVEVEFADGAEVEIPHPLKVTPLYRVVLRQKGSFNLVDGDTPWNDKAIFLKTSFPTVALSGLSAVSTLSSTADSPSAGDIPTYTGLNRDGEYWKESEVAIVTTVSGSASPVLGTGEVYKATILILAR